MSGGLIKQNNRDLQEQRAAADSDRLELNLSHNHLAMTGRLKCETWKRDSMKIARVKM